ncbi:3',5'-cyclic adenosine monophosphate phosphodiesterase CpdA [archaeon BMS3Abin16]|nr:3',5'-cyclic adenosine monophosphate phosphodiesterase CpdA [archaeon BMS3Abin16]HDY74492.1 metallophosphoesterase [Euryarchaeota archaeon]
MRLVHISDLHFGSRFNETAFESAVEEINSLEPDALVVSGDLSDDGLTHEFERARDMLKGFKCKNLIVCPGNHDYRNTGYLILKDYFSLKQVYETEVAKIIVLKTARPDKNEGEVGYRQQLWLEKQFRDTGKTRIVVMHHHLIPVPDTGVERDTVIDAGDVLAALKRSKIDLVLCGHKHRPWKWDFEGLKIMHAGSLSDIRLRGFFHNSYNIIDVDEKGIHGTVKVIGGDELSFDVLEKERMN